MIARDQAGAVSSVSALDAVVVGPSPRTRLAPPTASTAAARGWGTSARKCAASAASTPTRTRSPTSPAGGFSGLQNPSNIREK